MCAHLQAVVELLEHGADPNLPLRGAVRSALCAALSTSYEQQRTAAQRIALVRQHLVFVGVFLSFRKTVIFVTCTESHFSSVGKLIFFPRTINLCLFLMLFVSVLRNSGFVWKFIFIFE